MACAVFNHCCWFSAALVPSLQLAPELFLKIKLIIRCRTKKWAIVYNTRHSVVAIAALQIFYLPYYCCSFLFFCRFNFLQDWCASFLRIISQHAIVFIIICCTIISCIRQICLFKILHCSYFAFLVYVIFAKLMCSTIYSIICFALWLTKVMKKIKGSCALIMLAELVIYRLVKKRRFLWLHGIVLIVVQQGTKKERMTQKVKIWRLRHGGSIPRFKLQKCSLIFALRLGKKYLKGQFWNYARHYACGMPRPDWQLLGKHASTTSQKDTCNTNPL